jgi:ribosomal protein S27AE
MGRSDWMYGLRALGKVASVIQMYCPSCGQAWLDGYNGAIVRRRARLWLVSTHSTTRLDTRRCPSCGARGVLGTTPL